MDITNYFRPCEGDKLQFLVLNWIEQYLGFHKHLIKCSERNKQFRRKGRSLKENASIAREKYKRCSPFCMEIWNTGNQKINEKEKRLEIGKQHKNH